MFTSLNNFSFEITHYSYSFVRIAFKKVCDGFYIPCLKDLILTSCFFDMLNFERNCHETKVKFSKCIVFGVIIFFVFVVTRVFIRL